MSQRGWVMDLRLHSECVCACQVTSVVSDSLWLWPARLLCPWDFPGTNTGVGSHFLLKGIFLTQGSNPCLLQLLHWKADSLPLSHLGSLDNTVVHLKILTRQRQQGKLTMKSNTGGLIHVEIYCFCCSVAQSCLALCNPMDYSTPGFPLLHYLPKSVQTHVH